MATNRSHIRKSFHRAALSHKHFNAETLCVPGCAFGAPFNASNKTYSDVQQCCHYITPSVFIFRGDLTEWRLFLCSLFYNCRPKFSAVHSENIKDY
jgi:hypothetical protein